MVAVEPVTTLVYGRGYRFTRLADEIRACRCVTATDMASPGTDNGESVVIYDFAEQELAHIRNVVGHLEHVADCTGASEGARCRG